MNKAARNERVKLTAAWLNGIGIAAVAVGGFAPMTAFVLSPTRSSAVVIAMTTATWCLIGLALHLAARAILTRIEE